MIGKRKTFWFPALVALVIGLVYNYQFEFVGTLRAGEVICFVGLICLIPSNAFISLLKIKIARNAIIAIILWATIQLASDFHNGVSIQDILKGHANFGFGSTTFLFLAILFRDRINVVIVFYIALGIGGYVFVNPIQTSAEIISNEYWDIRISYWLPALVSAAALFFVNRYPLMVAVVLVLEGMTAIALGGRSSGLMIWCVGFAIFMSNPNMRQRISRINRRQTRRAILTAIVGVSIAFPSYVYFASQGIITKKAQEQIKSIDNPYNPIEVILAGRGGIQYGINALVRRPIAGYGSRAYTADYLPFHANRRDYNYIHSIIFESGAYGGIFSLLCCLWLLVLALRRSFDLLAVGNYQATFVAASMATSVTWAFLASPLAYFRLGWPIAFAISFAFQEKINQSKSGSAPVMLENHHFRKF